MAPLLLSGEELTPRSVLGGLAVFAGLAVVLLAERRQHRQVPVESPVGE
jgi:drug/metabolite transporter (DMT)-like permease